MTSLANHPERNVIRLQLRRNVALQGLSDEDRTELESHLIIEDGAKADFFMHQGMRDMEQYFILDGILKRVVSNTEGKEMILRFAAEDDMETSYAAWRLEKPTPYGIVCVTKARVARMPMPTWAAFLDPRPAIKQMFEYHVMGVMSEVMAHTITLHLLDGQGRVRRFLRKQSQLLDRIPQKELASYLNLSPETLSRLMHSGKI
jgi:CRP/FNR family transcriptional regulator, dissimilatory nitrate respiration regulator